MTGRLQSVLIIHSSDEMYGADSAMLRTATALRTRGVSVRVIVPDDIPGDRPLSKRLAAIGCDVEQMRLAVLRRRYLRPAALPGFLWGWLAAVWRIRARLRQARPDVVYSNTLAVTAGAVAARWCGVPHLWHVHEILVSPRWLGILLARLARTLSTRVVAVSDAVTQFLSSSAPGLIPSTVRNGIPDPMAKIDRPAARARVERELGLPADAPLVLFVGRLSDWKGPLAFAQLAEGHIRSGGAAHFLLIGGAVPGETDVRDRITPRIADQANNGRLHWIDFTPEVPTYLARATVFVLPSLRPDPFPATATEAMFAAIPVVTFAHGGVLEMIGPVDAGIAVPVGDVAALGSAVNRLLDDPETAGAMGRRGREYAARTFTAEAFTSGMIRELEATAAS